MAITTDSVVGGKLAYAALGFAPSTHLLPHAQLFPVLALERLTQLVTLAAIYAAISVAGHPELNRLIGRNELGERAEYFDLKHIRLNTDERYVALVECLAQPVVNPHLLFAGNAGDRFKCYTPGYASSAERPFKLAILVFSQPRLQHERFLKREFPLRLTHGA